MFFINAPILTRFPTRVKKTTLMNSPNTDGIRNRPRIAPLATTRHFTSAETVCEISANNSIQTTEPITIALASQRFVRNHEAFQLALQQEQKQLWDPGNC